MLKDTFDVIVAMIEFIKDGYTDNAESRKDFFHNYIDESFKRIEEIHTDYMTNLNMLMAIKQKNAKTTEETIEWLRTKKISFQTSRDRVKKIEDEVFSNKYFKKSFKNDTDISKYTLQYVGDIVKYFFRGPLYLPNMTWYNYLIQVFEFSLVMQQAYPENGPAGASANASSADIFNEIKNTVGFIDSQYNFIAESYSALKKLCLK